MNVHKSKVAVLCTGNSCRSQMAEGFLRALRGAECEAFSAGLHPKRLDPRAVAVMAEEGIDISTHRAKSLEELSDIPFDLIITVCGSAQKNCPLMPGQFKQVHRAFDDPPHLSAKLTSEQEILEIYRRVRDEIRAFILSLRIKE